MFRVDVSYSISRHGFDLDSKIEKVAPRQYSGSGAGLGSRDHGFRFRFEKKAKEAIRKLKALKIPDIEITIENEDVSN